MTMSSDSDGYELSDSSVRHKVIFSNSRSKRPRTQAVPSVTDESHVHGLASSLRRTRRNLNAVDGLLGYYRDSNERQSAAIERLRDNLAHSTESLRQERLNRLSSLHGSRVGSSQPLRASDLQEAGGRRKFKPTSPHTDYSTVKESRRWMGRHMRRPSVRFHDDLDEIHDIHQTVRDLSSNQIRLEDDLDQEIQRRNQVQIDNQKAIQELNDSFRLSQRNEEDKPSERVDKRLQAIQEELQQQRMHLESREKKKKENGQLSAELKQAVEAQSKHEEKKMREHLIKAEAEKQQLAMQLETAQVKLDRSKAVQAAMQDQMEEYKTRLKLSDHKQSVMQEKLSDLQAAAEDESLPLRRKEKKHQRLQETDVRHEQERQHLEEEIAALKSQLTQSEGMKDLDKYRRDLQQCEKQRDQLSQHLESVSKELENKERRMAKLIAELQDASGNLKTSQEQHKVASSQLKELEKRLGDSESNVEKQRERLLELERRLEETRQQRENMRTKATDKIRQWKLKCAKQQRDVDSLKQRLAKAIDRSEQLLKDGESYCTLNGTSSHRMDTLQREINDILEKRAQQDEQLRLRDIEVNELKSVRKDLEQELRDTRNFMDKLDNELRAHQVRYNVLADEKLRLEEDLKSQKAKSQQAEDHMQKLQTEWHKVNLERSELCAQLAEESGGRRMAEAHIRQLMQDIKTAKEDAESLTQQLKQEKRAHDVLVEDIQKENEEKKSVGDRKIMDQTNRLKRERAEMDAELQTLKIEITDKQTQLKTLRRHLEESKTDAEKARADLFNIEQENAKLKRKYERAKAGFQEQAQLAEVENSRASELEGRLQKASAQLMEQDLESECILHVINKEVDHLVEACSGQDEAHRVVLSPTRDTKLKPQHWLAEIKSKLQWLQKEMSNKNSQQMRLEQDLECSRTEIDEVARLSRLQKHKLESQIVEQHDLVHELRQDNQDLMMNKRQKEEVVKSLEKQVVRLEHHIESNVRSLRRSLEVAPESNASLQDSSLEDFKHLQELQEKRDLINDRYNRYKGTVTLLQQQLEEAKQSAVPGQTRPTAIRNSYRPHHLSSAGFSNTNRQGETSETI